MTMMQSETQSDSELEVNLNGGRDHGAASHFKSCTLYLEVKLAEMLSASKHSLTDPTRPDANRFSVCWQLLGELSRMKTPFVRVLSCIYQELDRSIHSGYVTAKSSSPTFQPVPYFELVDRVEARKLDIESEKESWKNEILVRQNEIVRVEQEIKGLKEEVKVAESLGREMEKKLIAALDAFQATVAEGSVR